MFVGKFFGGKIPEAHASKGADELADLGRNVAPKVRRCQSEMVKLVLLFSPYMCSMHWACYSQKKP